METDPIQGAYKMLHNMNYSNRAIASRCHIGKNTIDKIAHGHIITKQYRDVFKSLMKEVKNNYNAAFDAHDYDKAGAIRQEIHRLLELYLGI